MVIVEQYTRDRRHEWNVFLDGAKNSTFLFHRDYMDYHADRFDDHSLMIYEDGKLQALLPANLRNDGVLVSHGGLTYGGFVFRRNVHLVSALKLVRFALAYLQGEGIFLLKYKALPSFYRTTPSEEVDYALFLLGARLYRRDATLTIDLHNMRPFAKGRKYEISKARRAGIVVEETRDFGAFWSEALVPNLMEQHGLVPVHTVKEISLLASRFPYNIRQFCAYSDGALAAGVTMYETEDVAHSQYIGLNDAARRTGALSFLMAHLILEVYTDKRYFDIGVSTEKGGRWLNAGLVAWKEGLRGTCFCHDFYEIDTNCYGSIDAVIGTDQ
jgi:hypothetical protein